jgi:hypothetical protein
MPKITELENEAFDLTNEVLLAIAERYNALRPSLPNGVTDEDGGYIYNGRRTDASSVVFTFGRKRTGKPFDNHDVSTITPERVLAGEYDHVIRDSFFDRASAEYWYTYCKDYGSFGE